MESQENNQPDPSGSYHGTRGSVGVDTSSEAADAEKASGKTSQMMRDVLFEVGLTHQAGITSAELRALFPGEHHGRITSALTKLHIAGHVVALRERRGNCGVYVTPSWVNGREERPYKRQKQQISAEFIEEIMRKHITITGFTCSCAMWSSLHRLPSHTAHIAAEIAKAINEKEA